MSEHSPPPESKESQGVSPAQRAAQARPQTKQPQKAFKLTVNDALPAFTMEERSCRACKYYSFDEGVERSHAANGECRRYAPCPGPSLAAARWPIVTWKGWCGEWESGVSNEDMVRMARAIGENLTQDI